MVKFLFIISWYMSIGFGIIELSAQNVALYGMTNGGGNSGHGTVFKYYPAVNSFVKLLDFDSVNGANPQGSLVQDEDEKLYGLTRYGGLNNFGVIFQYDIQGQLFKKLYDFTGDSGVGPLGTLTLFTDGKFYSTASGGGLYGLGTLFGFDPGSDNYYDLHDFDTIVEGIFPDGTLCVVNKTLYGSTISSVLFEFTPGTGHFKADYNFDPQIPSSNLTQLNGKVYGQISAYAVPGYLFEFDPVDSSITNKHQFDNSFTVIEGGLLLANNGLLYGMTFGDTTNRVFPWLYQYDTSSGNVTVLHNFDSIVGDGNEPWSGVIQASNGLLYGMTSAGGINNDGTIFSYDYSTQTYTKLFDFDESTGTKPLGNLLEVNEPSAISTIPELSTLSIYPNPATVEITVQAGNLEPGALAKVEDVTGRIVLSSENTLPGKFVFDIRGLSTGAYTVQIKQNDLTQTGRFVKIN